MEISIIMPVYNETVLLKRSISSVIRQTFTNWELIIVDDGSAEAVIKICQEYVGKDSRIRLFHQKHSGQAAARNRGLSMAEGRYVAFMDADDYMHPRMLEQLYQDIVTTNTRIAVCGFKRFRQLPQISVCELCKPKIIKVSGDSKNVRHATIKDNVYLWNKLYQRSLFEHIKFKNGRFYEDLAVMHKLFAEAGIISYNRNVLYFYYQNPAGTIQTLDEKKIADYIWAYEQRIKYYYYEKYETDLEHVTHAFLYKAYELYMTNRVKEETSKKKIKKKLRKCVNNVFKQYELVQYLPFHGKIRYWAFIGCPPVFEAELWCRKWYKRFLRN